VEFIAGNGTGIGFSPRTSIFLISPMLLTHLQLSLHSALTRRTKGRNLRPLKKKAMLFQKSGSIRNKFISICYARVKDKVIPLQAWTDPEGSRRLRLTDFKKIGT
jgi:hypothetical protein